jgi:two-component system sensor histidine kinase/response regulator
MPEMSGYELANQIRNYKATSPTYQSSIRNLSLIALSSLFDRDKQKYTNSGFDDILSKPIRKDKLYQILENEAHKRRLINEGRYQKHSEIQKQDKTQSPEHAVNHRSSNILLAEDNPINQKLAKMMLTKVGHKVDTALTGKEAFEKYTASSGDFDLILMDMQMPEMDGIEATRLIRIWEENNKARVPIIALTANAIKGDKERCLEGGMDDYITKPIDKDIFFEVIEKWLA